jgi:hypothetical protein
MTKSPSFAAGELNLASDRFANRNGGRRFCGPPYQLSYFGVAAVVTAFFVWFGIHRFRKMEKSFADLI